MKLEDLKWKPWNSAWDVAEFASPGIVFRSNVGNTRHGTYFIVANRTIVNYARHEANVSAWAADEFEAQCLIYHYANGGEDAPG